MTYIMMWAVRWKQIGVLYSKHDIYYAHIYSHSPDYYIVISYFELN